MLVCSLSIACALSPHLDSRWTSLPPPRLPLPPSLPLSPPYAPRLRALHANTTLWSLWLGLFPAVTSSCINIPRARRPQVYATLNGVLQGWGRAGRWGKNDHRRAVVLAGFSAGVLKSMAPFTTTPRCVSQLLDVLRVLFLTPGCLHMAVLEELGAAEDAQAIQVAANGCCGRCSRCLPPTAVQFALAAPVDVTDEVSGLLRLVWAYGQLRRRPALGQVLHPTGPWARNLAWAKPGRGVHATLAVAHCLVHGLLNIEAEVGVGAGEDGKTKTGARHCYRLWIDADNHPSGDPCVRNPRVLAIMRGQEVVRIWLH